MVSDDVWFLSEKKSGANDIYPPVTFGLKVTGGIKSKCITCIVIRSYKCLVVSVFKDNLSHLATIAAEEI